MKKTFITILISFILNVFLGEDLSAQCNQRSQSRYSSSTATNPAANRLASPSVPSAVPFDGGASLLLIAGVAYAIKKMYDFRKKAL